MDEKTVENAMQIIMFAGDARDFCKKALDKVSEEKFEEAEELFKKADEEITKAHHIQTDCIQGAIAGEEMEYNVLFSHAQDTLMTIYSEIGLAKKIFALYRRIDERLK
ncbi:MAG: PTS lactose/cellobiose transporter subunit IIA [Lachnospiraceae bacterium]|nr:PTS lactose/cellobiose transporter subunit IIA [Lachnospiraceae bacterium]